MNLLHNYRRDLLQQQSTHSSRSAGAATAAIDIVSTTSRGGVSANSSNVPGRGACRDSNSFLLRAFGKEDKSHVTPELLSALVAAHDASEAVVHLVRFVYFNPAVPENLNVHAPKEFPATTLVFDGLEWTERNKEDTAAKMVFEMASDLMTHIEDHPSAVTPIKADDYDAFYSGIEEDVDLFDVARRTIDAYSYVTTFSLMDSPLRPAGGGG